ncbi:MAG: VanZ family protein [Opitutaceae bacterium]|jgi:VanZ family protein
MARIHKDLIPLVLWMGFIFIMSSDLGSYTHTLSLIESLMQWLKFHLSAEAFGRVHFLLRKGGHLFEYAVLAMLILHSARLSMRPIVASWSWKVAAFSFLAASAYAATDELHQVFVPTRTASLQDVLIDSGGALLGLSAAFLWRRCFPMRYH